MSARAVACQRGRIHPALIVALSTLAGAGCLVAAVVQVLAAAGPALLTAGLVAVAGWLVKTTTAGVPLGWLAGGIAAVAPWLLAGVLAWLVVRDRGRP